MAGSERWRQIRKSNRTWDSSWLPAVAALAGGILAALVVIALAPAATLSDTLAGTVPAFLLGALAVGFPALLVRQATGRIYREVRALLNVRPLVGDDLVGADRWSMDAVFAEQFLALVDQGLVRVVECGSGRSTVLIARRLEERGEGHVTAFEHLEPFAERTRSWLEEQGLAHRATVIHAPITEQEVDGVNARWYDPTAVRAALPDEIDLLIVDGPPEKIGPRARWPAAILMADRFAPNAAIHMDDGDRADERTTAFAWRDRLGGDLRYVAGGKGGWLLRLPGSSGSVP